MSNVDLFVVVAGGRIDPAPARAHDCMSAAIAAAEAAANAALVAPRNWPTDPRNVGDIATRLAHMGILH